MPQESRLLGHSNLLNQISQFLRLYIDIHYSWLRNSKVIRLIDKTEFSVFRVELERQEEEYWRQYSGHKQQLLMAEDEYRCGISQSEASL